MRCPACRSTLEQRESSGIRLDICSACGGVWFDRFEMKKMEEPFEPVSEEILSVEGSGSVRADPAERLKCPRCDDLVMMRHSFSVRREVEIDECPGCGGVWLDQGELAEIRSLFASEADRDEAARKLFAERFDGAFRKMRAESRENRERARRFANLFRFLCPSSYIPGKQKWGAF